jgi:diacylglycerol O-acyltransferase
VARAAASPGSTVRQVVTTAHGALSFARLAWPARRSSLTGPLTPHRAWGCTSATLDDVRIVRKGLGGTVNDVVLTAITRGFRELLLSRGEEPGEHVVRTLVPVSVRHADARGVLDNRVTALIAELPVELAEPAPRLAAVRLELARLKRSGEPEFGELVTSVATLVPPPLLSLGLTGTFRVPHRHLVTVTTNVPGPQFPLYACGRRLREYYPYVPIADRVRIGVAITSYDGALGFGVTADEDSTPDVQVLLDGITAELEELVALAGGQDVVVDLTDQQAPDRSADVEDLGVDEGVTGLAALQSQAGVGPHRQHEVAGTP